jgi:cell wall-associated NlpC family hydrolase
MRFIYSLVLSLACTVAQAAPLDEELSHGVQDWLKTNAVVTQVISAKDTLGSHASNLVMNAMDFLGVPYKRGGTSAETGFDCSGFVRVVYEQSLGLILPRRADDQAQQTTQIPKSDLRPGDLVFFNTMRRTFSHVGIYVGDNKFIHSPRAGGRVRVESMGDSYWVKRFTGARRVEGAEAAAATMMVPAVATRLSQQPSSLAQ